MTPSRKTPDRPEGGPVVPLSHLLTLPAAERAAELAASDHVAALVPRIPPLELLFTLKSALPEDALALLSHARPSQVRFAFDMELWDRDEMSPPRAHRWLTLLDGLDDTVLERWAGSLDVEDFYPLLGQTVRATLAEEDGLPEGDPARGTTSFTLDGIHAFVCGADVAPLVRRLLTWIRRHDPSRYARLVELLLVGFTVEDEETALHLRRARLAELGFPDFDEAQKIYAPLSPERLTILPPRREDVETAGTAEFDAPAFPLAVFSGAPSRLRAVLERFAGTQEADDLLRQIGRLAAQAVAADGLDPSRAESYLQAANKVAGLLSIGLETLHGPDTDAMVRSVSRHWLAHLLGVGAWRVERMAAAARTMIRTSWPQGRRERLSLLDAPLPEQLAAISAKRPKWAEATSEGVAVRDFSDLSEVEAAERLTAKAQFLGRYLLAAVGSGETIEQAAWARLEEEGRKGRTILLTALAQAALGRTFRFAPLAPEEAGEALSALFAPGKPPRKVRPEFLAALLSWSRTALSLTEREDVFLEEYLTEAATMLEEEFGNLPAGETPDPRFTQGLWIA